VAAGYVGIDSRAGGAQDYSGSVVTDCGLGNSQRSLPELGKLLHKPGQIKRV